MSSESDLEFLVADFQHWAESYFREEEIGERRVNFLITLATAVLGGVAALVGTGGMEKAVPAASFALVSVLALGVVTLLRVLRRNSKVDGYVAVLRKYRARLGDPELNEFVKSRVPGKRGWLSGGLFVFVSVMNGLVLAALAAILTWAWCEAEQAWPVVVGAILAFAVGVAVQFGAAKLIQGRADG